MIPARILATAAIEWGVFWSLIGFSGALVGSRMTSKVEGAIGCLKVV